MELSSHFPEDRDVELVLRAPVSPSSTTSNALAAIGVPFIRALAPVSAAAQVIDKSLKLSFDNGDSRRPTLTPPYCIEITNVSRNAPN